jgi:hypothetical protein
MGFGAGLQWGNQGVVLFTALGGPGYVPQWIRLANWLRVRWKCYRLDGTADRIYVVEKEIASEFCLARQSQTWPVFLNKQIYNH